MAFTEISDSFGKALQDVVRRDRQAAQGIVPRRNGFPVLHQVWPLRVKLLEDLPQCGTANAQTFAIDDEGGWHFGTTIAISDPLDFMAGSLLAVEQDDGSLIMPAGSTAIVKFYLDAQEYEVINYGDGACENDSSGGDSGGGSGGDSGPSRSRRPSAVCRARRKAMGPGESSPSTAATTKTALRS